MDGNGDISSLKKNIISGKLLSKQAVASPNNYVLNCAHSGNSDRYAVVLSNHVVQVFENGALCAEHVHDKDVTSVKFSNREPSLLFSSALDGKINVWDARCKKPVQAFCEDTDGTLMPLTCFDYNLNEELICGGTELIREDSFLIFWDRRSTETLGGYWNSHTDEITQVHFNPFVNSCMASSSVDGLINIFDLNARTEDDALAHTLNIGSAVNTFCWRKSDVLSCTTTMEEFQLWSTTEGSPSLSKSRGDLARNNQLQVDYLIDSIIIADHWFLVTGTYTGMVHLWSSDNDGLKATYCLLKGHSDIVRTVSYSSKENIILTGGEDGSICKWRIEPPR